ncbi:uncharacterized protein LOC119983400 [Tripterygium wilfordii]|uniref:uncharacterized protein LOC119983400 n=1 Tax=Tripterygium wilfordii TaxID=458696 RepID=UPI0018F825E3|nr:uncharacterized protein LOC119983400 [Tripterygium wilfordii]
MIVFATATTFHIALQLVLLFHLRSQYDVVCHCIEAKTTSSVTISFEALWFMHLMHRAPQYINFILMASINCFTVSWVYIKQSLVPSFHYSLFIDLGYDSSIFVFCIFSVRAIFYCSQLFFLFKLENRSSQLQIRSSKNLFSEYQASTMDYTPLRNLEMGQRGSTIIVRVARMWDSTNPSQQDQLMSVDLLFVDEQGTTIQGSIRKEYADRITEFLLEGHIYKISNFFVGAARKTFKVSKHEHIIRIGTWTIISEMSDTKDDIPMNCFNFVDDQVLESRLYNDVELTDVMGHLTSVLRLTTTFANGRMVGKKNLLIQTLK